MGSKVVTPATTDVKASDWQNFISWVEKAQVGKINLTFSNMDTLLEPKIQAGGIVEIAGTLFSIDSEEGASGWSGIASGSTVYMRLVPSGDTETPEWTTITPVWRHDLQGWYESGTKKRYVLQVYKDNSGNYGVKQKLPDLQGQDADTVDGAHKSTDGTFASNSDVLMPTEKATKTFLANRVFQSLPVAKTQIITKTTQDYVTGEIFGGNLAFRDNYLVVGAINEDDWGTAYVFHKASGKNVFDEGVEIVNPTTPARDVNDNYGGVVAITGDFVAIAADGKNSFEGRLYVYQRTGTNAWSGPEILFPSELSGTNYMFPASVAIDGDYLAAGETYSNSEDGRVWVYRRTTGNVWNSDVTTIDPPTAGQGNRFGAGVGLVTDGTGEQYLVITERLTGIVHIYRRTGTNTWGDRVTKTTPFAYLDKYVAISEDYVCVGDTSYNSNAGAIEIFHRTALNTWDSGVLIENPVPRDNDRFGVHCAIYQDNIVVGAYTTDQPFNKTGSAFLLRRTGDNAWEAYPVPPGRESEDLQFGNQVGINDEMCVIGASGGLSGLGCVYAYRLLI
jgi:hypothetical protein